MTSELKPDLSSFGYADGGYMSKCSHCKETFIGAKRAWSCEPCATKKSLEPKITRAAPDVPELVRYSVRLDEGRYFGMAEYAGGKYVLHSQAAEIIAAKDKELNKHKHNTAEVIREGLREVARMRERAEAAEAELATLKEINANLMGDDEDKPRYTTKRLKHEIEKAAEAKLAQYEAQATAPAADMKEESRHDPH